MWHRVVILIILILSHFRCDGQSVSYCNYCSEGESECDQCFILAANSCTNISPSCGSFNESVYYVPPGASTNYSVTFFPTLNCEGWTSRGFLGNCDVCTYDLGYVVCPGSPSGPLYPSAPPDEGIPWYGYVGIVFGVLFLFCFCCALTGALYLTNWCPGMNERIDRRQKAYEEGRILFY